MVRMDCKTRRARTRSLLCSARCRKGKRGESGGVGGGGVVSIGRYSGSGSVAAAHVPVKRRHGARRTSRNIRVVFFGRSRDVTLFQEWKSVSYFRLSSSG